MKRIRRRNEIMPVTPRDQARQKPGTEANSRGPKEGITADQGFGVGGVGLRPKTLQRTAQPRLAVR